MQKIIVHADVERDSFETGEAAGEVRYSAEKWSLGDVLEAVEADTTDETLRTELSRRIDRLPMGDEKEDEDDPPPQIPGPLVPPILVIGPHQNPYDIFSEIARSGDRQSVLGVVTTGSEMHFRRVLGAIETYERTEQSEVPVHIFWRERD